MKEFELTMKLRNNCLKARRLALGLTAKELAEKAGLRHSAYVAYETMYRSPIGKPNGIRRSEWWKDSALKLAIFHRCTVEELWPEAVLAVKKPVVVAEVEARTALALASGAMMMQLPPAPDEFLEQKEAVELLRSAMGELTPREEAYLRNRFENDKTHKEASAELGVSKAAGMQMEARALRKLRKLNVVTKLRDFE